MDRARDGEVGVVGVREDVADVGVGRRNVCAAGTGVWAYGCGIDTELCITCACAICEDVAEAAVGVAEEARDISQGGGVEATSTAGDAGFRNPSRSLRTAPGNPAWTHHLLSGHARDGRLRSLTFLAYRSDYPLDCRLDLLPPRCIYCIQLNDACVVRVHDGKRISWVYRNVKIGFARNHDRR